MHEFKTEQESFWLGEFGDSYIDRNNSKELLAANLHFFSRVLQNVAPIESVFEVGCNIGMNLSALQLLLPTTELNGIEINQKAAEAASKIENVKNVVNDSIINFDTDNKFDFVFSKGVLIHINPDELPSIYEKMAQASTRYVMIAEYYNPSPVTITYRGHEDRLFKRDFANEFMQANPEFQLIDYAFHYKKTSYFSQDDITWFLMEKKG